MPLAKALREGNEAYYLEHGTYANDKANLDVITNDTNAQVTLGNETRHKYVRVSRADSKNRITMYQKHSINFPDETHCEALIGDSLANWLCKDSLKGTYLGNKYGYSVYALDENSNGMLARIYINGVSTSTISGDICIGTGERGCGHADYYARKFFTEGSICFANSHWSCNENFDHSYCVANFGPQNAGCRGVVMKNYSVCYANRKNTCVGTYDATSCCMGTYCTQDKCAEKEGIDLDSIPAQPVQPTY